MSNVPVAPPIPPPLPTRSTNSTPSSTNENAVPNVTFDKCHWAIEYPDLLKACYLARICLDEPPLKCQYYNIKPQLQIGPTCGLTALSMLLAGTPTAVELLKEAKELGFTYNGELFSAKNLFELVCKYSDTPQHCKLYNGDLNSEMIQHCLLEGSCIFVPYPF